MTTWTEQLAKFRRPACLLNIVRSTAAVPDDRFFNDPIYKPLHTAWAAGCFVLGLERLYGHPAEVRLEPNRFPDFHVRQRGQEYEFEFTTAGKPESRRGTEYKKRTINPLLLMPYQPARGGQEGVHWITNALRRKYRKHYSTSPHLLVYANFEADTLEPQRLATACRPWAAPFSSVWILWNYQIAQLFDSEAFGLAHSMWCSIGVDPWVED